MNIYVVRHGETKWNAEGRLQGWLNSELTDKGKAQAARLREVLQIPFQQVYSSPSKRAADTAKIITNGEQPILFDERLKEIHLGSWQGRLIADIEKEDGKRYECYVQMPETYIPDTGESIQTVKKRMNDFLQDCLKNEAENILVVTHGVSIRALLLAVYNWPIDKIWSFDEIDGTSVTKIVATSTEPTVQYIGKMPHSTHSMENY